MNISISASTVIITGNIKTVSDFQSIKNEVGNLVNTQKNITIKIIDSLSITSSVIGYFNKLILKDKIDLNMQVSNAELMDLLKELNLDKVFRVTKVS